MKAMARDLVASVTVLALTATPALATKANQLQSLVGMRGSSGESELENKGFTSIDGRQANGGVHTYWWHGRDKNCIDVFTSDGNYQSIRDAANSDCNQKNHSNAGAAVAGVAVGALLIAALTSHKSDHHDNSQHLTDQQAEAQYERGYSDGLHNTSYHNYDKSESYAGGYTAGVEQRRQNTSYHSGHGGYSNSVSLQGIKGQSSIWAFDEMTNRGFRNVDAITSGNTQYGIYYNGKTRQCVQVTNADNRVYDIREIDSHPKCR